MHAYLSLGDRPGATRSSATGPLRSAFDLLAAGASGPARRGVALRRAAAAAVPDLRPAGGGAGPVLSGVLSPGRASSPRRAARACGVPFEAAPAGAHWCATACRADPPPWGAARAALRYDDQARRMLLPFKYGDRIETGAGAGAADGAGRRRVAGARPTCWCRCRCTGGGCCRAATTSPPCWPGRWRGSPARRRCWTRLRRVRRDACRSARCRRPSARRRWPAPFAVRPAPARDPGRCARAADRRRADHGRHRGSLHARRCSRPGSAAWTCWRRRALLGRNSRLTRSDLAKPARRERYSSGETQMPNIEIYTQPWCPYCERAVGLLTDKGVPFKEIKAPHGSAERGRKPRNEPGGSTTVPQIFIDGRHVGGCDDLVALGAGQKAGCDAGGLAQHSIELNSRADRLGTSARTVVSVAGSQHSVNGKRNPLDAARGGWPSWGPASWLPELPIRSKVRLTDQHLVFELVVGQQHLVRSWYARSSLRRPRRA